MKGMLLVYGAGAIGRGFLPWVMPPSEFTYCYVEVNPELRRALNERGRFTSLRTKDGRYERLEVPVAACFAPGEEREALRDRADAVITAVGPRNMLLLAESLRDTRLPVICCENDASLPELMASVTGNSRVVFAIPDVITSNTAPRQFLEGDPLAIVTEDGTCFVDERASQLGGNAHYVSRDELERQWLAKLYVHNTPHCIAAYLGALSRVTYIHEAMQVAKAAVIVAGAMQEMQEMLVRRYRLDRAFVDWYAGKELARFRNTLLFDPITRVAREPFRKLAANDRLIGAAELGLSSGMVPHNVLLGIMAAFCYENRADPDFNISYLIRALHPGDFLRMIIGLRPGEALFEMLLDGWERNLAELQSVGP